MKKAKRPVGKPPKFKNESEFREAITAYFDSCYQIVLKGRRGQPKVEVRYRVSMPNKAGLCYHLKICRETWAQYKKKYTDAVKDAEFHIENEWVQRLGGNAPTGAIFYLKNAFKEEYKDKHEVLTKDVSVTREDLKDFK